MRSIRSGASSRFLIFTSPQFWAPRSEYAVFNLIFGFLPLIGAILILSYVGLGGLRALASRRRSTRPRLTRHAKIPPPARAPARFSPMTRAP